jgi:hypothetical protein
MQISESYGKLPLSFEENRGQVDRKVKFLSRGSGYTLFLTATEAVLSLNPQSTKTNEASAAEERQKSTVLRMKVVGANPSPQISGLDKLSGKSNYFIGSDPAKWRTNVATYSGVKYSDVYPGIDLVYYGIQGQLEYDWNVAPGAKPEAIRFAVEGADRMRIDSSGDLILTVLGGEVRLDKPLVYQETDGVRREIAGDYMTRKNREVGFRIADYDPTKPLVVDPVLVYSTYHGGAGTDQGWDIAVDSSGSAYVAGYTTSTDFPTANPYQPVYGGGFYDAFITKLNPAGNALVYSTYYGGAGNDYARGIAVDSSDNAYVTGYTDSTNFPTANPRQPANAGTSDAFVTKFNPSGSVLVYSTYHGGSSEDFGFSIAVDTTGNAYVTGRTSSINFPTANPRQPAYGGGNTDAFATKFNPSGNTLVYSTYHGGSLDDLAFAVAVDPSGSAYLTGSTESINFPTANPLQPVIGGAGADAFVTKFNPSGSALSYSTYLGGSGFDFAQSIAVDTSGNAYVTGVTSSGGFPTFNPLQPANGGGGDAFVTKLNPSGAPIYSTYHGGTSADHGYCIAADSAGNAYVTGYTYSPDFPTANPLQPAHAGGLQDAFVTKFNAAGSALVYSTYHGGSGFDEPHGIFVDSSGNVFVTGITSSSNFPLASPLQPVYAGSYDAFISKIGEPPPTLQITMSKSAYVNGETIAATVFRIENLSSTQMPVELAVWLELPALEPVSILNFGRTAPSSWGRG